jgi:peptide/nickel transport system substrate-binding protein
MRTTVVVVLVVAAMALLLAACGTKEVVVTKEVIQTVVVEKQVTVEKEVVQTVVMEKEVVATPTRPPAGQPRHGGTLRIVSQASIPTLDPQFSGAYVTIAVAAHMFEALFNWDTNLDSQPQMVDTWEVSQDGLTWTFNIRPGMKFHDGTTVTATDVVTTFNRWLNGIFARSSLMKEFTVEAPFTVVGENTFTLNLKEPNSAVPLIIGKPYGSVFVMPTRVGDRLSSEQVEEWVGSGPYKFSKWDQGDKVILNRFEDYVPQDGPSSLFVGRSTAYIDSLIWLEIPDEETKLAGLETGEWDVVDGAGLDFYNRVNSNPDLTVPLYRPGHRTNVIMPPTHPPFDNTVARLAAQTGMDDTAVMSSLGPDALWDLCPAVFFCGTPWETDIGAEQYYNLNDKEEARRLLTQSGYTGETITLLNPTDYATITPVGIVVRQELENIGFTVDMPALDWATVVTQLGSPDTFSALASWDVHWNSSSPLDNEAIGAGIAIWPKVPKLLDLRKKFIQAATQEEKFRVMEEMQVEFFKNVNALYVGVFYSIYPHTSALKNLEVKAVPFYANTWLER